MTLRIYGIPNCDTVRKARNWLDRHGVEYELHDFRKDGVDGSTLRAWAKELGWQSLLNRRGTSWRKVPDEIRARIDEETAIQLMLSTPSMIKRPVLDLGKRRCVGFNEAEYASLFL